MSNFQSALDYELCNFVDIEINREYTRLQETNETVARFHTPTLIDKFESECYCSTPERKKLYREMRITVIRYVKNNFRNFCLKKQ